MSRTSTKPNNIDIFEEARETVIKLETLSRLLTRSELEALEILFNKLRGPHWEEPAEAER